MTQTTSVPRDLRHLLCLGFGYTATALARHLAAGPVGITGTSRSAEGAATIDAAGWRGLEFSATRSPAVAIAISQASHILVSVPPDDDGDPVLRLLGHDIATAPGLRWIGYLSTIGVYGDHGGGWVDETTPPAPISARSRRRLAAEDAWRALARAYGLRLEVFRLPGIYGPGRSAIDQIRAGTARRLVKPGQVFNRMHVDDIAAALACALTAPPRFDLLNLADDEPAPASDVVAYAAALLGTTPPPEEPFATARLSPMAASFWAESKRVSNRRMKQALGLALRYPTYREGLAAIAAQPVASERPR